MAEEKLEKAVFALPGGKEFVEEVERLDISTLEARITKMQKDLNESQLHKADNMALKHAKEEVAMISGPYNDVEKAVKLKTKFIISLLKEKGAG